MLLLGASACAPEPLVVPTAEEVESYFAYSGQLSAEMSGNVAVITVSQDSRQLRRGGVLWAKVGPYVVLFSQETKQLFEDYSGLAAVRVVTKAPGDRTVAEALLARDTLNDLTWRRALNVAGHARTGGTERPSLLDELVRWGEDHTEFEYNPRYVPR